MIAMRKMRQRQRKRRGTKMVVVTMRTKKMMKRMIKRKMTREEMKSR
jgi:hypothetical protein